MATLLVVLLIGASLGLLWWGLRRSTRIYQFPFLAGAIFLGWLVPQAIGLLQDSSLPPGGLEKTLIMAILCAAAIYAGYTLRPTTIKSFAWRFSSRRLLWGAAALSLFGAYFQLKLRSLPEWMDVSQWTGLPVAYLFFAQTQLYAYAIALLLYSKQRSYYALAIAGLNLAFFLHPILIDGRRGLTTQIVLMTLLAFWFGRGWLLPRAAMISGIFLAMLLVTSIGQYRTLASQDATISGHLTKGIPRWEEVTRIDYIGEMQEVLRGKAYDLRNAVYSISAAEENLSFNLGISYWNAFVFRYIPAQVLGSEFKSWLIVDLPADQTDGLYTHVAHTGSTPTGLSDSFRAFWYFGAFVFLFIARIMRTLYVSAVKGHMVAQLAYMLIISDALHAITHGSSWFFMPWVHIAVFMFPILHWSRKARGLGSYTTEKSVVHNPDTSIER